MFSPDQYQLLDFGEGRKLERFGVWILDRPAPAVANEPKQHPSRWKSAHARYERSTAAAGRWQAGPHGERLPDTSNWSVQHASKRFPLKLTNSGAVGVYPEQAANWVWLSKRIRAAGRPLKLLNLFAYTGGSTLAAAAAGAAVVHVDAARSVVAWARQSAALSDLENAPIRWIAEDALKFAQREVKRGNQYDGVVLDPPTYGHGPKGQPWQIESGLRPLLQTCRELVPSTDPLILFTCHATLWTPTELSGILAGSLFDYCDQPPSVRRLEIVDTSGRPLPSGLVARWPE
jgi:23S rRNA (cytosine1962-C5)-methyltransferase